MGIFGEIAARYTRVAASQTDSAIVDGGSCVIYGIHVEGSGAGTVTLEEYGTTTVIGVLRLGSAGSTEWTTKFRAHQGLQVTTTSGVTCTVFHSGPGV